MLGLTLPGRASFILVAATCLGVVAGVVGYRSTRHGEAGVTEQPDARIVQIDDLRTVEEQVFALRWARDGRLWFVSSSSDGHLSINQVMPDRSVSRSVLPGKASSGPHTFLAQDAAGSFWVAANYSMWLFDPKSGTVSLAVQLDRSHPLATEAADDQGAALPGSWIDGLEAADNGVWFTRHNVRALFQITADGTSAVRQELSEPPRGLTVVDDRPLSRLEALRAVAPSFDLDEGASVGASHGCSVAISPAADEAIIRSAKGSRALKGVGIRAGDLVSVSENAFVLVLNEQSRLVTGSCEEDALSTFELGRSITNRDPLLRGGHLLQDLPGTTPLITGVVAIAVGPAGQLAFSDATMRVMKVE